MTPFEFRTIAKDLFGSGKVGQHLQMLREFNAFRALRIDQFEVRHSNMLGWLLDPHETHGFGSAFLERFLSLLLQRDKTPKEDLSSFVVRREEGYKDIVLRSCENQIVIVIENKWNAAERISKDGHVGQLRTYTRDVEENPIFKGWTKKFVYLTPSGEMPSKENRANWTPMSYRSIVGMIEDVLEGGSLDDRREQRLFIKQYISILKTRTDMMTQEERQEWISIYLSQKEAFDIMADVTASVVGDLIVRTLGNLNFDDVQVCTVNARPQFLVRALSNHFGECDFLANGKAIKDKYWYDEGRGSKCPCRFFFEPLKNEKWMWQLKLVFRYEGMSLEQEGKMKDLEKRVAAGKSSRQKLSEVWHSVWKSEMRDFAKVKAEDLKREVEDWVIEQTSASVKNVNLWLRGFVHPMTEENDITQSQ